MGKKIKKIVQMIAKARKVVIFTGAGVSTESGIPDFRSPGGFWTKFDPDDFTIDKYLRSRETRRKIWKIMLDGGMMANALPNTAHLAIAELGKMGKLSSIITQNIDNLHQKAANYPACVHELHGNMEWMICLDCAERYPVDLLAKGIQPVGVPECAKCGGILKPNIIFFGEALPAKALKLATEEANQCDLFIIIGSSLVVYPAAYMPMYAKRAGAEIAIINLAPTEQDNIADIIINHSAGETMTKIIAELKRMEEKKNKN
jgi:NAD-dependent deacetylase